ncbi:hypothetical protein ACIPL1_24850 [Pseudomonas sp. NPDC090202]|uniref:hypothetical protein n=1 Tax=Pseudomonas sp. NPDC090202 TaxID=3364476 RepID=UPI00381A1802
MTAVIAAGQHKQEEGKVIRRLAEGAGLSIEEMENEILQAAENALMRRFARNAAEAAGGNVVPFLPKR